MPDRLKILYVDDEPDIRTIVGMALALDPAIDVRMADSGQQALALLGEGMWMPDLALIDMMMPGISGIEVMQAMRTQSRTASVPVVFVTASARGAEVERYLAAGAVGVISKPFDPMRLARTVRDYCRPQVGQ
ncbi:response regulator [soil metagenome]